MEKILLSDERLVSLHHKKKVNAFFTLYNRYKNYAYAIIGIVLKRTSLYNALYEEKDSLYYESLCSVIDTFDEKRGTFRAYLSKVVERNTIKCIREFQKDPLCDYISMDSFIGNDENLHFSDTLTFKDSSPSPVDRINCKEQEVKAIDVYDQQGIFKRKVKCIIRMRQLGFSVKEIACHFNMSESSIRSIFYRIRKYIDTRK